jgi:hypothetical protein
MRFDSLGLEVCVTSLNKPQIKKMQAEPQELYLDMVGLNFMSGFRTVLSFCTLNLS